MSISIWTLVVISIRISFSLGLLPSSASRSRKLDVSAVGAQRHEGIKCDSCFMDPIIGVRFECTNVPNLDVCSVCALSPSEAFTVPSKPFNDLTWRIVSRSSNTDSSILLQAAAPSPTRTKGPGSTDISKIVAAITSRKAVLLDVREQKEFEDGHLLIAVSSPLSMLSKGVFPENPDTGVGYELDQCIYIHASDDESDNRASEAAEVLREMRYMDVEALPEGVGVKSLEKARVSDVASGAAEAFFDTA